MINAEALSGYRLESAELSMVFSPEVKDYFPGCKAVFVHENAGWGKNCGDEKITIITSPLLNKILVVGQNVKVLPVSEAGRVYRYGYLCAEVVNLKSGLGLKITCQDMEDSPCLTQQDAKKRLDAFLVMWPYENIRIRYHRSERHLLKPYLMTGILRWCLILDKINGRFDGVFVNVDDGGMSPFNVPEEFISRIRNAARYRVRNRHAAPCRVYLFNGSSFDLADGYNYLLSRHEAAEIWRKTGSLFRFREAGLQKKNAVPVLYNGEKAYLLSADGNGFSHQRVILISAETGNVFSDEHNVSEKLVYVSPTYTEVLGNAEIGVSDEGFVVKQKNE